MTMILAGDIGGTKTILAVFPSEKERVPLVEKTYQSRDFPGLDAMIAEFLQRTKIKISHACFAVAGPVNQDRALLTNLGWDIDCRSLEKNTDLSRVRLVNDLVAVATAVPFLESGDLVPLNEGVPDPVGTIAVIAPGTGLGEAFLTWNGSRYQAFASEGGHADFAPTTALEIELLAWLREQIEHVSYEQVCSGIGIPHVYSFLKEKGHGRETEWLAEELRKAPDPNPVIMEGALGKRKCSLCQQVLGMFVSILAGEAGNMAVTLLARGGVYLGGGIPGRILPALRGREFMACFCRKGRMAGLLRDIPVHVILDTKAALRGAAILASKRLKTEG